ncbi:MAG TPA: gliding motility-associated C-terminal domain-containing protein, partial [Chitinophagaceae bacterium]|nr:gliding motility-associated C-terminal domain-containing protein [Chitinophagaceae bacterium]
AARAVTVTLESKVDGVRYPDQTAMPNIPLQLQARSLGSNFSYLWSPATGLNFTGVRDPVFVYDRQTEYLVSITSPNGCITVDTILVKMIGPVPDSTPYVFVPKAWSPNGDGHNDYLYPLTIHISQINYFRIFDRWGKKMFETTNFSQGWDGKLQGIAQGIDVYIWTFEGISTEGKIFKAAGQAVLLR